MNRVTIALALALSVAALAVPSANATPNTRVQRLTHQVRHYKTLAAHKSTEARKARRALRLEKAKEAALLGQVSSLQGQAATLRAQVSSLSRQNAALSGQVSSLAAARDAAREHAATLQARLNAIPTPLAAAVEQVRREVAWAQSGPSVGFFEPAPSDYSAGMLTALAAMDYVRGHVSGAAYGYLGQPRLPLTPDGVLEAQAGMCGHAALTFAAIVRSFGFPVRSVQFYFSLPDFGAVGHIAVEVYYDGGWHFFDPFFGAFWEDGSHHVLSITDARAGGGTEVRDKAAFTDVLNDPWYAGDSISFELDPGTAVELDKQPFPA